MGAPKSTKYQRRPTDLFDRLRRFVAALPGRSARPVTDLIERALFGASPGDPRVALRGLVRRALRDDLAATREAFEADFYLKQCEDPRERARAAIDPQLHYTAIGRARRRAPARAFDPIHYRRFCADLSFGRDPFAHYLTIGRARGYSANAVDGVRAPGGAAPLGRLLVLDHPRGGGSTSYLALAERTFRDAGYAIVRLRHVSGTRRLALWDDLDAPAVAGAAAPVFDLFADEDAFVAHARDVGVTRILVNHVIDRPQEIFDWIARVAARLGAPFDIILHDFYFVCPRVNAVEGSGVYCGLAEVEHCRSCVAAFGSELGGVDPAVWRGKASACVAAASRVWAPSADAARRLDARLGAGRCEVWRPEDDDGRPPEATPRVAPDRPLRVVLLGALNVPKGSRVLLRLAEESRRRAAPLAFTVIGPSDETASLMAAGVKVHGRYDGGELARLVEEAAPDLIFLPAIWPETWSFALSHALDLGLPVAVFDIGAPAERLRALNRGHVLPLAFAANPAGLLDALLALRARWVAPT